MKRFLNDLKKYKSYIIYRTKADLKAEVTGSYLSWLWLVLEPLCFMLIYTFIHTLIFNTKLEYYTAFVFVGLTIWNFFSKTLLASVKLVKANRDTVTKVYVPKWVLLLCKVSVNFVKFLISFGLVIITIAIYKIPLSWNVLWVAIIFIVTILFTFGLSAIFMHLGVFIEDLSNLTAIGIRMMFYMSGVFFVIENRIGEPWNAILSKCNPIAAMIIQLRRSLSIIHLTPSYEIIIFWGLVSVLICIVGIKTIYKYENTYVKVMKS